MKNDRGEVKLVKKKTQLWQSFQKLLLLHADFPGSDGLREYANKLFSITNINGEALKGLKKIFEWTFYQWLISVGISLGTCWMNTIITVNP